MPQAIHISPIDNVVVALHPIAKGTLVEVDGLAADSWVEQAKKLWNWISQKGEDEQQ